MNQPPNPEPLALFGPLLAAPFLAEQAHEALGNDLAAALLPLTVYCERQEAREELSDWQQGHLATIRQYLAAFDRYDEQFEGLLASYRQRLAAAHARLTERVPPLELALVQAGPDWQSIVFRLLHRLYQHEPGVALACQRVAVQPRRPMDWQATAFRLLDRLYRHEPSGPPSPFVAQVRRHLDHLTPRPLSSGEGCAAITSHTLDTLTDES